MPDWRKPELPPAPDKLVAAFYVALRAKDYATLKHLCHDDFVFSSTAHPEKRDCPVHLVGADKVRAHLAMVEEGWEILHKMHGSPKPQPVANREPRERGSVFNVSVHVHMRNRVTGLAFIGTKRQEWLIQNGKISAMSEFFDADLIDAMKPEPVPAVV